jgi:hypothetical protein
MKELDDVALALPHTARETSADGRPSYLVGGKLFCCHRGRRKDAVDERTGERLDDVLMFRVEDLGVKELLLADERGISSRRRISTGTPRSCCGSRTSSGSTTPSCAISSPRRG